MSTIHIAFFALVLALYSFCTCTVLHCECEWIEIVFLWRLFCAVSSSFNSVSDACPYVYVYMTNERQSSAFVQYCALYPICVYRVF